MHPTKTLVASPKGGGLLGAIGAGLEAQIQRGKQMPPSKETTHETVTVGRDTFRLRERTEGHNKDFIPVGAAWGVAVESQGSGATTGQWFKTEAEAREKFAAWTASAREHQAPPKGDVIESKGAAADRFQPGDRVKIDSGRVGRVARPTMRPVTDRTDPAPTTDEEPDPRCSPLERRFACPTS